MSLEQLTARVRQAVGDDSGLEATIKFNFGDDGIIYIDGASTPNTVSNEDKDSKITIMVSRENFERIIDHKLNPKLALMTGKMRLKGDIRIAHAPRQGVRHRLRPGSRAARSDANGRPRHRDRRRGRARRLRRGRDDPLRRPARRPRLSLRVQLRRLRALPVPGARPARFVADWPDAPGLSPRDRAKGDRFLACQTRAAARTGGSRSGSIPRAARSCRRAATTRGSSAMRRITATMSEFAFMTRDAAAFCPVSTRCCACPASRARAPIRWPTCRTATASGVSSIKRCRAAPPRGGCSSSCRSGHTATLDGPFGDAYLRAPCERRVLCIAGGSGLSPMLSILRGSTALAAAAFHRSRCSTTAPGMRPRTCRRRRFPTSRRELVGRLDLRIGALRTADRLDRWDGRRGSIHEVVERELGPSAGRHSRSTPPAHPPWCARRWRCWRATASIRNASTMTVSPESDEAGTP